MSKCHGCKFYGPGPYTTGAAQSVARVCPKTGRGVMTEYGAQCTYEQKVFYGESQRFPKFLKGEYVGDRGDRIISDAADLAKAVGRYLAETGQCPNARAGESRCGGPKCAYCSMAVALGE